MEGTIRTYPLRTILEVELREIIENTAKALGCEAELEYYYYAGPV